MNECPIHKVEMTKYEKEGRSWYSHRKDDGTYCNGKVGGFGNGNGKDPRRIERQHSQHMALIYLQLKGKEFSQEDLKKAIDWFQSDLDP